MRVLTAFLFMLVLMAGSTGASAQGTDIKGALERLVAHPERQSRFVVIDHLATGKFVQFDFTNNQILIDLPVTALTADELERARSLFASSGVASPNVITDQHAETGEEWAITTYQLGFGSDSAGATDFANRVMREVYLLPRDAPLAVTEGSR